jgi:hypothetical protein
MVRRAMGFGGVVAVILLLVFVIKGCRDSAREQSFKDYVRNVDGLVQQSDQESKAIFGLLDRPASQSPIQLQTTVNGYRTEASQLVDRSRSLDHPDELAQASRYVTETLELRRDGVAGLARQLPSVLSEATRDQAAGQMASHMQELLASDVVYNRRAVPSIIKPTRKEGILSSVEIVHSHFLHDLSWLNPDVLKNRLSGRAATTAAIKPGLHGTSVGTVTVKPSGQQLQAGGAAQIKASPNLAFDVQVMNQGDNAESQVQVRVSISGAGSPIVVEQKIPSIAAGQPATATVPLAAAPPTGRPVTITVQVVPVPGEKNATNNKQTFGAVFTP